MLYDTIIVASLVCALQAGFAWRMRAERGAPAFIVLMLGVMVWGLAYAQELRSADLAAKILWSKIEYIGIVTVPVAWLAFAIQYTERQRWVSRPGLALLATPSLIALLLVWTNEAHGLIWRHINLVPRETFVGWRAEYGPGFWIYTAYAYLLLLAGTLLLVAVVFRRPMLYRGQAGALLVGSLFPWAGNLLYNFGLSPLPGVELAPFTFTITGLVFTLALARWRLFDIVPIARDRVIERMGEGVIVLDTRDRVVDINPAACRIVGQDRRGAIGRPIVALFTQEAELVARFLQVEEADEQIAVDLAGERKVYQARISPLRERSGAPGGRLVILSDITGLKLVEQEMSRARTVAEDANTAKSAFLATMSHEIRTPLNGVLGMTDLLMQGELSAQQQELAQMIHSSGSQLLGMINTILDFSKIEAGQLELDMQPFSLRGCIESSLDIVAAGAAEKGLELSCLIEPGVPAMIVQDATRLRQILVNLLNNAVKFTQRGEVVLAVARAEPAALSAEDEGAAADSQGSAPQAQLRFSVRDTGIGIPADRMGRLFRAFSQADAATTRTYGGTGLGLVISRLLATAMGGSIAAESVAGEGSTFSFTVSCAEATDESARGPAAEGVELRGKRALIVDDSESSRQSLALQIEAWGMRPTLADSAAAALELLRGGAAFDLAILDLQMPGVGGAALADTIRRSHARALPIVLLSTLGAALPMPDSPATAILRKPVKASRLYNNIVGLLRAEARPPTAEAAARKREPLIDKEMARRLPLRILIAEDNAINQQLILRMLGLLGYQADVVADGQAAVDATLEKGYDLVLMDVQMPVMDGLEATRAIRASLPRARQPRIIAVTAGAVVGDREACLAAGMDGFITKPIDRIALTNAVARSWPVERPAAAGAPAQRDVTDVALDATALRRLVSNLGDQDGALLPSLIATFIESAASLQAGARAALGCADAPGLRRAMHTLKSNASTFGAHPLARLCRDLEARAAEGVIEGAGEGLDRVDAELARVRAAFAEL